MASLLVMLPSNCCCGDFSAIPFGNIYLGVLNVGFALAINL
jgi:hypothetical protein